MPTLFLMLFFLLFGMSNGLAQGTLDKALPIHLDGLTPSLEIQSPIRVWIDEQAIASIDAVSRLAPAKFKTIPAGSLLETNPHNTVWIHLPLQRYPAAAPKWVLNLPLPYLDQATLYSRSDKGEWLAQSAGDTIAVAQWAHLGLYPEFELNLPNLEVQDLYLKVNNFKAIHVPLRLATTEHRAQQRETEYMGLGLMIGALSALLVWSVFQFFWFRNAVDGWYSLYIVIMTLTVATITGLAPAYLWPNSELWTNMSFGVMPAIAIGLTLLFVRHLAQLSKRYLHFDRLLLVFGWGSIASSVLFFLFEHTLSDNVNYFFIASTPVLGITTSVLTWRRKNPVGLWLTLAYVPQFLGLTALALQRFGLASAFWEIRYLMCAVIASGVPLMLQALNLQSRELKSIVERVRALSTQDALTGLLTAAQFDVQLRDAINRSLEKKEHSAVVMVDIVNYELLRQTFDEATAEKCLLRAAIKLYRVIRDIDSAGRIGTARFGLIIEGANSRRELTERMVKLIGSGLIPLAGFKPDVILQFHMAAAILSERLCNPDTLLHELSELQASMSRRTKRPIRFLEQPDTSPMPLTQS